MLQVLTVFKFYANIRRSAKSRKFLNEHLLENELTSLLSQWKKLLSRKENLTKSAILGINLTMSIIEYWRELTKLNECLESVVLA